MSDNKPTAVVAFGANDTQRKIIGEQLSGIANVVFLADVPEGERRDIIDGATVLLGYETDDMLLDGEFRPANLKFIQFLVAGVDHIRFSNVPEGIAVAANRGHRASSMAEHIVAMALGCARRLMVQHEMLTHGEFNQFTSGALELSGGKAAILGYGGVGRATAKLLKAFGMEVHAINRSGKAEGEIDFIGTLDDLDAVLKGADLMVISLALTSKTQGLIGARELGLMKETGILVNVARGEIVDEAALYAHLTAQPKFFAGLDAWWIEPVRHGEFRMDHPFLDLPNVIGSPHNSSMSPSGLGPAITQGAQNVAAFLKGETPRFLVQDDEKLR